MYGFVYGTDGSGSGNLIVPVGGMRYPYSATALEEYTDEFGNFRTNRDLYMNGSAVMNFALDAVPETLNEILRKAGLSKSDIDYYVFHQANRMMLEYLRDKCGLQDMPYWNDVTDYGNTVSSSVPVALADMIRANSGIRLERVMIIGFGVGFSWGGCVIDCSRVII